MYWDSNKEKLLCMMLVDDKYSGLLSPNAGDAFFRAFIVEDRKTKDVIIKFRFKYKNGKRNWYEATHKTLKGKEAMEYFRSGMELTLIEGTEAFGLPVPDDFVQCFYPPDDEGDAMKTIEWLVEKDLIEVERTAMTGKELHLTIELLNLAADEFGRHGCCDMDRDMLQRVNFTDEEKLALAKEYHEWNGDPEEFEGTLQEFDRISDYAWMRFMANKLYNSFPRSIERNKKVGLD
jgi:hypothetical protein